MSLSLSRKTKDRLALTRAAARDTFTLESVGDACFLLPEEAADRVLKVTWRAVMMDGVKFTLFDFVMSMLGHFSMSVRSSTTLFETYHAVSRPGRTRLRWRRFIFGLLAGAAYLLMLLGVVVLLMAAAAALFLLSSQSLPEDRVIAIILGVTSIVFVALGAFGRHFFAARGLPPPLRVLGRWPIHLYSMKYLPLPHAEE